MGRKLWLGIALVAGVVIPSASPEAAPSKPGGETTFTLGWAKDEPTLRAEGRGVKFFKQIGRERVLIRIEVPGDRFEVEADTKGAVRIGRNGRFLRLQMQDRFAANVARIQKLTAGSAALDGFESMVGSLDGQTRGEARSVMASYALLHALRGSLGPARSLAAAMAPATSGGIVRAMALTEETPYACWAEYASALNQHLVDFTDCTSSYWWIPGWNAACAAQYALQGELAFFWLISCSGGMPV